MAKESINKKLSRVRSPRVHITYDVENGGAIQKREIPFVVGVLSDLSGQPEVPLPPMTKRKFVDIDRDNFDKVLAKCAPRLVFKVDNRLSEDDNKLGVELRFSGLGDFAPAAVARQIPSLRKLLELRNSLQQLQSSLITNDKLDSILQEVLTSTEALQRIGAETPSPIEPVEKED